jgi:hypothetical protein
VVDLKPRVSRTPKVDWGRDPRVDLSNALVGKWASGYDGIVSELVEVDSRRRVTLGQHARHQRYLITSESDGTVILTPAVVVSELEARLLRRPDLVEKVRADLAEPETRMKRRRKV